MRKLKRVRYKYAPLFLYYYYFLFWICNWDTISFLSLYNVSRHWEEVRCAVYLSISQLVKILLIFIETIFSAAFKILRVHFAWYFELSCLNFYLANAYIAKIDNHLQESVTFLRWRVVWNNLHHLCSHIQGES